MPGPRQVTEEFLRLQWQLYLRPRLQGDEFEVINIIIITTTVTRARVAIGGAPIGGIRVEIPPDSSWPGIPTSVSWHDGPLAGLPTSRNSYPGYPPARPGPGTGMQKWSESGLRLGPLAAVMEL